MAKMILECVLALRKSNENVALWKINENVALRNMALQVRRMIVQSTWSRQSHEIWHVIVSLH